MFTALVCAPDQRVNTVPYYFDTGLVAYGFLASRPRDFAAYGSYSGHLRRAEAVQALTDAALGLQSWEMTLEINYGCTVRQACSCSRACNTSSTPAVIRRSRMPWLSGRMWSSTSDPSA
jgi:hypothetical protein